VVMSSFIASMATRSGDKIQLPVGITVLGRKTDLFKIKDKKCSRKQVVIDVDRSADSISVKRIGINPARLTRRSNELLLDKEKDILLENGDLLEILIGSDPVTIDIEKIKNQQINGTTEKVVWEWQDDAQWKPYDEEPTQIIEKAFQENQAFVVLTLNNNTYIINLSPDKMVQINNKSKFERPVRRVGEEDMKRKREEEMEENITSVPKKKKTEPKK